MARLSDQGYFARSPDQGSTIDTGQFPGPPAEKAASPALHDRAGALERRRR